ncbi:MAG: hypothetical protein J5530_01355 [Clostridia bacterium]|nr:hypothetical protein [Clostridia bacterium]
MKSFYIRSFHCYKLITGILSAVFGMLSLALYLTSVDKLFPWALLLFVLSLTYFLFGWVYEQRRYKISSDGIVFSFFGINYKRILFDDYPVIIISNAAVSHYGTVLPIRDRARTKTNGHPVSYPYFVVCTGLFPLSRVKPEMNSVTVHALNYAQSEYIGICWEDALAEVIDKTDIVINVQSDIFGNYKEFFRKNPERFAIIKEDNYDT